MQHMLGILGLALGTSAWVSATAQVPDTMYAYREAIVKLAPGLVSKDLFMAADQERPMKEGLERLDALMSGLKKHERLQGLGFKIPAKQLQENSHAAVTAFAKGQKDLSWMHLRALVHGCNQCHTQVSGTQAPPWHLTQDRLPKGSFALAETWYLFRDYSRAMEFYLSVISQYGLASITLDELRVSLEKVLAMTLRIDRSPQKAHEIFSSIQKADLIPLDIKTEIGLWLDELSRLKKMTLPTSETSSAKSVDEFSDQVLRQVYPVMQHPGSRKASAYLASGVLLEFVNSHEKAVLPRILYWLGVSLRETDDTLFSSSSTYYLAECIRRFPKDPVAKVCYSELSQYHQEQDTGSLGLFSSDLSSELVRLKKLLDAAVDKRPQKR